MKTISEANKKNKYKDKIGQPKGEHVNTEGSTTTQPEGQRSDTNVGSQQQPGARPDQQGQRDIGKKQGGGQGQQQQSQQTSRSDPPAGVQQQAAGANLDPRPIQQDRIEGGRGRGRGRGQSFEGGRGRGRGRGQRFEGDDRARTDPTAEIQQQVAGIQLDTQRPRQGAERGDFQGQQQAQRGPLSDTSVNMIIESRFHWGV